MRMQANGLAINEAWSEIFPANKNTGYEVCSTGYIPENRLRLLRLSCSPTRDPENKFPISLKS